LFAQQYTSGIFSISQFKGTFKTGLPGNKTMQSPQAAAGLLYGKICSTPGLYGSCVIIFVLQ
jgi:hypothetical protein